METEKKEKGFTLYLNSEAQRNFAKAQKKQSQSCPKLSGNNFYNHNAIGIHL